VVHAPRFSDLVISRPRLARDLAPRARGLAFAASINIALVVPVLLAPFVFVEGMRPPRAQPEERIRVVLPRPGSVATAGSPGTGPRATVEPARTGRTQAAIGRHVIPIVPPAVEEAAPDRATTTAPGDSDDRSPGGATGTGWPGGEGDGTGPGGDCCDGPGGPGHGGDPGDEELSEWDEGLVRPVLIPSSRVLPKYPDAARKARVGGTVVLTILIGPDGTVGAVEVLSAPDRRWGFDRAAIEAVSRWRYQPGHMIGRPVAVRARVTVEFILSH
jgi:TonB family protein